MQNNQDCQDCYSNFLKIFRKWWQNNIGTSCWKSSFSHWCKNTLLLRHDHLYSVQFLSLSCSLWQKSSQITGFGSKLRSWRPRLGNPGSATELLLSEKVIPIGCGTAHISKDGGGGVLPNPPVGRPPVGRPPCMQNPLDADLPNP